jgi:hypothetical protein
MTIPDPPAMTIEEIVARVAAAHQRLLDAIAPLTDEQLQAPVLGKDGWSVKDVLAHLAFWDQRLFHAVDPQGGLVDAPPVFRLTPPLIADIPYDDQWLTTVNARIYALNQGRNLEDVRAEFDATRQRMLAVVASLSPQVVSDLDALTAPLGEPFSTMLHGAAEHYEEHAEELETHLW